MTATPGAPADGTERDLVLTRVFDAPRPLVFKAWTEPERLARWLGPKGFTAPSCDADVRPEGAFRFTIRSPEGEDYRIRGRYREVVEPERLVFTWAWEDADGRPGHETLVTVSLAERDGKTELTFHQGRFPSVEQRDSHGEGWSECLDRLERYLGSVRK